VSTKKADVTVKGFRKYWRQKPSSLISQCYGVMNMYPEAAYVVQEAYKALRSIEILAKCTPAKVGESSEWSTILSNAEENRASFSKILEGKPLFSALFGIYTLTLNELKVILKVNAGAGQSGTVTIISLESTVHNDYFKEVKRRKRHISNNISQTAKKSIILAPKSAAGKLPTKAVITHNCFAPLTTNDMDIETTGAENILPEKEVPRKSGRPPPAVKTSTKNLILNQSDLR
jgi:hypothetical protein